MQWWVHGKVVTVSSEISLQWVNLCVCGVVLSVMGTGCVATANSPMAKFLRVCGKLYKPKPTVVVVREEPQWLSVYEEDCSGSSFVSPQPKSKGEGNAALSKALDVATLRLQGMPRFAPPGVAPAGGAKGGVDGEAGTAGFPVIPLLPMTNAGAPRPVPTGSAPVSRVACPAGQSRLQTEVYFPRGGHEVSGPEREKLRQLRGRPISYVRIDGLTEAPGGTSSMVSLAQARAQAVQRVIQDAVVPGASIQQGLRAGCCTTQGEPGSAGKEDLGVFVSACLGTVTEMKKGEASSMAK